MTIEEVLRALADGHKINDRTWDAEGYIYLSGEVIKCEKGLTQDFDILATLVDPYIWHEPKPKKRYWQWKLNVRGHWFRNATYMDDNGFYSDGTRYFESREWDKMEKIKIEDDYIEV